MFCGTEVMPVLFDAEDQLRSRWGWFRVNLQHSQALSRASQIKVEGRL